MIKRVRFAALVLTCCTGALVQSAVAAIATSQTASIGLTSTMDKGIVSIMTDPVLADDRLVLKVVAHNPTSEPLTLRASDVHVFTAAGKEIGIQSLDSLIAQIAGSSRGSGHAQAGNYSRAPTMTTRTGEMDVTGIAGSTDAIGNAVSEQSARRSGADVSDDPVVQQQIDGLKAGILQTVTVEPGKATGGQLVTEKIKFSRKEAKALHVTVEFNGETHQFDFEAPPAK